MNRDMSYDLDDVFSSRNAGELVSEEVTKTRVLRTPGLRVLKAPGVTPINDGTSSSLALPLDRSLMSPMYRPLPGLEGDITLPVLGTVSVQKLAIGAAVGLAAWYFLLRRR